MVRRLLPWLMLLAAAGVLAQAPPPGGNDAPGGPPPEGGQRRRPDVVGKITAISGSTLTVHTMEGKDVTVKVTDKTDIHKERKAAKLADLAVGDGMMMRGRSTAEGVWEADTIGVRGAAAEADFREALGKKFIVGEIKAIDGLKLTIARIDGQTQVIEVDENTSFRKDRESITLGDLKVGDRVFGRGEMKDGVFTAAMLGTGDPRMLMGPPPGEGGQPH